MLRKTALENILFLDIETIPAEKEYTSLSAELKEMWSSKTQYQRRDKHTAESFYPKAGIWAEFGKIICISVGYFVIKDNVKSFRVTTFHGEERQLLKDFKALIQTHFNKSKHLLCAHNGKEFDFPYIARRMVILGIELPDKLDLYGKKPWEVPHLDTLELWKFGDFKHYTSLKLMAHVLGVPSPKKDIDGSQVRDLYYEHQDMKRIIDYCEEDTIAIAQVLLRLRNEPLLLKQQILHV